MAQPDQMPADELGRLPWARILFRAFITIAALLAFAQPFLAGSYLSGQFSALNLHKMNAFLITAATLLSMIAAVLTWRLGDGARWPAVACGAILVTEGVQIKLGYEFLTAAHIVIGSTIVTSLGVMLVLIWRPASKPASTTPRKEATAPE